MKNGCAGYVMYAGTGRLWVVLMLGAGVLGLPVAAQESAPPVLRLPPCAQAPVIDGVMSAGEWDGAFQGYGVMRYQQPAQGQLERRQARYWLTYDAQRIYIAFQTELPPWGKLDGKKRRIPAEATGDDSIEIFIDPARPGKAFEEKTFYQFLGNFMGTMCNFAFNARTPGSMPFNGTPDFQNTCADGWWTAEFSVSAADLEGAALADGEVWGLNFCRFWHNPRSYSSWPARMYADRVNNLKVTLDTAAPVVQLLNYGAPHEGTPGFEFSIYNPTPRALELAVAMRVEELAADGRKAEETRRVTVPPGQRETVGWKTDWTAVDKDSLLAAEVKSADGKTVYYRGQMGFDKDNGRPTAWAAPEQKEEKAINLTACFYPGFSRVRAVIQFGALKMAALVNKAVVTVLDPQGKEIGRQELETFLDGEGEVLVQLPKDLPEGRYTVELKLLAGQKPIGQTETRTFEKKTFPFENNTIGMSDKVLAPWTPMQVDAAKGVVSCWNREFTLGDSGLFKQVKSGKFELLAGPARLIARSAGTELEWKAAGVTFGKTADSAVEFTASSECPKVKADIAVHSEFDGMVKYTLTLSPNGDGQVDGVDLVVPLKEETAWLLHATSDGCRTSASTFTPAGEGRVWDSTQLKQWRLTGSFIPYLWLGDDRVGLCWWADSEKGWVRPADKKEPAIEVRREKGEVQMVFHLIAKPFTLTEPRTLVFAFNATPVRPRPSWARGWTMSSTKADGFRKGPHISVYGSAAWVSFGKDTLPDRPYTYASLRPISDEADTWLKGTAATNRAKGTTMIVYTDIISRAVDRGDEVKHYAAEWDRYNTVRTQDETAKWPSNGQLAVNMTRSRIDYDLWCMQHGTELGIDGWYFDEIQTTGQLNPGADLGFIDESGQWESECSLFGLRDYFKRLYTMLQEQGRPEPFIMPHSSSTMYAGPMAFASIPMDLEMSSPDPDPNRGQVFGLGEGYALCNIMAFNHGFAGSGMVCPAPHAAYAAGDWRMGRTFLGSMLLFDCHPIFGVPSYEGRLMDSLLGEFGYDDPSVQYVPYWRAGDLQQVGPERVHVSLFRNPGRGRRALLAMYNDNPAPVMAQWKPSAKFGLRDNRVMLPSANGLNSGPHYVAAKADGSIHLYIPPYDYRLAVAFLETNATWGATDDWGAVDPKLFERNVQRVK